MFQNDSHINSDELNGKTSDSHIEKNENTVDTYYCECCISRFDRKYDYKIHMLSKKHLKNCGNYKDTNTKYSCIHCNFYSNKKSAYDAHLITSRHIKNSDLVENSIESPRTYNCPNCTKKYFNYNGFYSHKVKCSQIVKEEPIIEKPIIESPKPTLEQQDVNYIELVNKLLIENQELRNFIIEQAKEDRNKHNELMNNQTVMMNKMIEMSKASMSNSMNNSNNNSNNKFNINMFLNEQCKDAINFSEFIENIEVSHEDLENNARLGFVQGISKIFIDNLKQLGLYERPIHCTDIKRETMYIRDDDKWDKQEDDTKVQTAIRNISYRGMRTLNEWKENNPEYQDINSEFSDKCMLISQNTIAGYNSDTYYPKVVKLISKEVVIDKQDIVKNV